MKIFTEARIELISFDLKDIIATSGFNGEDDDLKEE